MNDVDGGSAPSRLCSAHTDASRSLLVNGDTERVDLAVKSRPWTSLPTATVLPAVRMMSSVSPKEIHC